MNATAIARAKEAIEAGRKLQCSPEADKAAAKVAAKAAKPTKKATPAAGAKAAAKGGTTAKVQPTAAQLKAAEKVKADAIKAKAAAKALKTKTDAAAKVERDKLKDTAKVNGAADYKAKIEAQKAATIERHRHEKLYNSFRARIKYMLYMDNPALGGLEGREALGWSLSHKVSDGTLLTVERVGEVVHTKVNGVLVDSCPVTEVAVLSAMESWTA